MPTTSEDVRNDLIGEISHQCRKCNIPILYIKNLGLNYDTGWFELEYRIKGGEVDYVAFGIRVDKNMNVKICKTTGLSAFNLNEIRNY